MIEEVKMLDFIGRTIIDTDRNEIKSLANSEVRDFSLEIAELEMIVAGKSLNEIDFETIVRSAVSSSGNDFLFSFPASQFPETAINVSAIRLVAEDESMVTYIYETDDHEIIVAPVDSLDQSLIDLAESYVEVLCALKPAILELRQSQELH